MFSGKSEELLRRLRRALIAKKQVQVFTSRLDDRYGGADRLSSHDGSNIEAIPVRSSRELKELVSPETRARDPRERARRLRRMINKEGRFWGETNSGGETSTAAVR